MEKETQMDLREKLIRRIEMNGCSLLDWLLKKRRNVHFYADKRKKTAIARFEFSPEKLVWGNDCFIEDFVNRDGDPFIEVMLDVKADGLMNHFNRTTHKHFLSESVSFYFTIRAYFQADGYLSDGNIELLGMEQKALIMYHKNYEQELRQKSIKTIEETRFLDQDAFGFFTRIWKNVDNENGITVDSSSLSYFKELNEVHRNIIYGVSSANIWGRYKSHYTDEKYDFQGRAVYPVASNFYDSRYFFYLEAAMEEIYTYYERIAYLLYIFLKPETFEPFSLSFNKLFERQTKKELEEKFINLSENEHYLWFTNRIKKEHKKLSNYRHPLVHYRQNSGFLKGSYNASRSRIWLKNAMDGLDGLIKMEKDMDDILKFVNQELQNCYMAFQHTVLLCESLELSKNAPNE